MNHLARRFRVRAPNAGDHHGHVLVEASFEAAAIAYFEAGPAFAGDTAQIVVHDLESGRERCFRIDLTSGEASSCG